MAHLVITLPTNRTMRRPDEDVLPDEAIKMTKDLQGNQFYMKTTDIIQLKVIPWREGPLRSRVYQATASFTFPQTEVIEHPTSLGVSVISILRPQDVFSFLDLDDCYWSWWRRQTNIKPFGRNT